MNAEIIAVGSELLLGQIVNSNASFLSEQLAEMGINVYFHTVVGDNSARLKSAIEIAESRADLLIFTGGLGPTKDDLTKETIAAHLGKKLVFDEDALTAIEQYFVKVNRKMTENNRKQAIVLKDAYVLQNDHGMAPGMLLEKSEKLYMLLPGPPSEMKPMFLTYGKPALFSKMKTHDKIFSRMIRFFGIGESLLETKIVDLIDRQSNPTIAPLASNGEVAIRLTAKAPSQEIADQLIDETEAKIAERVGSYIYGYNDTSLILELFNTLKKKGLSLAAAESLTGGMFQEQLTSIAGASNVYKGGFVTYSNEAKASLLKVNRTTLQQAGAVSPECAIEMAENAANLAGADIGISFTGVAGPESLEGHPPGTVFIGIFIKGKPVRSEKLTLAGSRDTIRMRAVKYACHYLIQSLKDSQST